MRLSFALQICALFFLLGPCAFAFQTSTTPAGGRQEGAYTQNPKFKQAIGEAHNYSTLHQYGFAADAYRKANRVAGGSCVSCLQGQIFAQIDDHDFKGAMNAANALEALSASPEDRSRAEYMRAYALYLSAGDKPKPDKLDAVHGLLTEAISKYPKNAAALFLDGSVLARLGRMEDAKAAFGQCVSCVNPRDPAHLRAEHFAQNPELSLRSMVPAFEVTALDGSKFNLDAMSGRVVLIDFWATWCGPCNVELPHMRQIAKEFAGQPLVIISVSWDADEVKWKDFIAKNEMTWVQYRDADHKLGDAFGVTGIPHYFTIDSDGVLTAEMLGSGSDVEGKLKKLLARAGAAQKESSAAVSGKAGTSVN